MKSRSRRFLVTFIAVALGSSLLSLPYLTPSRSPEVATSHALMAVAAAPAVGASWQGVFMAGH